MRAREPKYRTIAADLTAKIRDGVYRTGAPLPPQRELSAAYGVTLVTLRQALQVLQGDGLVSQQPGRGTFVTEPRAAYRLDSLRGLDEDLAGQGHRLSTEVLGSELCAAPARVAVPLGLPDGDAGAGVRGGPGDPDGEEVLRGGEVLRVERVRLVEGRPAVHQISWLRPPAAGLLRDADLGGASLYATLAGAGIVVDSATEVLRPGLLDARTALLLHRPAGEPVFVSERLSRTAGGVPVLLDEAVILGSAMEIRADRGAGGLSVQWTRPPA